MLQEKRFGSNEEVIAETEANFEVKDKSFYKKGIEKLEKRLNKCITFGGDYVDKWSWILPKSCFTNSYELIEWGTLSWRNHIVQSSPHLYQNLRLI